MKLVRCQSLGRDEQLLSLSLYRRASLRRLRAYFCDNLGPLIYNISVDGEHQFSSYSSDLNGKND